MRDGKSLFTLLLVNFLVCAAFFYVMFFYPDFEHLETFSYTALSFLVVVDILYFVGRFLIFVNRARRRMVRLPRRERTSLKSMQRQARANLAMIEEDKEKKRNAEIAKEREKFLKLQEREKKKHEREAMKARKAEAKKRQEPVSRPAKLAHPVAPAVVSKHHPPAHPRAVPTKVVQNEIHDNVVNINVDKDEKGRPIIIGSKTGKKVHRPDCIIAMKIPKEKRLIFHDKLSCVKAGYSGCSVCLPFEK